MQKAGIAARTVNGAHSPVITILPAEECVHQALHNRQQGIERFGLVTSGKRLSDGEIKKLTETVRYIKQASDIKCCASLGLLNKEQLKELRESGVENYHCNIETAPSAPYVRHIQSNKNWKRSIWPGKKVSVSVPAA